MEQNNRNDALKGSWPRFPIYLAGSEYDQGAPACQGTYPNTFAATRAAGPSGHPPQVLELFDPQLGCYNEMFVPGACQANPSDVNIQPGSSHADQAASSRVVGGPERGERRSDDNSGSVKRRKLTTGSPMGDMGMQAEDDAKSWAFYTLRNQCNRQTKFYEEKIQQYQKEIEYWQFDCDEKTMLVSVLEEDIKSKDAKLETLKRWANEEIQKLEKQVEDKEAIGRVAEQLYKDHRETVESLLQVKKQLEKAQQDKEQLGRELEEFKLGSSPLRISHFPTQQWGNSVAQTSQRCQQAVGALAHELVNAEPAATNPTSRNLPSKNPHPVAVDDLQPAVLAQPETVEPSQLELSNAATDTAPAQVGTTPSLANKQPVPPLSAVWVLTKEGISIFSDLNDTLIRVGKEVAQEDPTVSSSTETADFEPAEEQEDVGVSDSVPAAEFDAAELEQDYADVSSSTSVTDFDAAELEQDYAGVSSWASATDVDAAELEQDYAGVSSCASAADFEAVEQQLADGGVSLPPPAADFVRFEDAELPGCDEMNDNWWQDIPLDDQVIESQVMRLVKEG